MRVTLLTRIDHDHLENRNPIYTTNIGVFVSSDEESIEDKIDNYIVRMNVKSYRGYDGETYPQFKRTAMVVLGE